MSRNKVIIYNLSLYIRLIFKLIDIFINYINGKNQDKVKILMYHSIGGGLNLELDIDKNIFLKQIEYIQKKGEIISLKDSIKFLNQKNKKNDKNYFVLTFDDGYSNFYNNVFHELEKRSIPATLFPALEFIEKPKKRPLIKIFSSNSWDMVKPLTKKQLIEISKSKFISIGCHGYFHKNYSALTSKEIDEDLEKSKDWFIKFMKLAPEIFCYPMGYSNKISEEIIKDKFLLGLKADYSNKDMNIYKKEAYPRLPILKSDGMFWFKIKINGYLYRENQIIRKLINFFKMNQ